MNVIRKAATTPLESGLLQQNVDMDIHLSAISLKVCKKSQPYCDKYHTQYLGSGANMPAICHHQVMFDHYQKLFRRNE